MSYFELYEKRRKIKAGTVWKRKIDFSGQISRPIQIEVISCFNEIGIVMISYGSIYTEYYSIS